MSEKLTDAQVAALPGELLHAAACLEVTEDRAAYYAGWAAIKGAIALTLEVQQTRARRCGDCKWWERIYEHGHLGRCSAWSLTAESSHSCADFSKSEETR